MSSEKRDGADETGAPESIDDDPKKEKKKNRKLSWQETPKTWPLKGKRKDDVVIKLETTSEDIPGKDVNAQSSISDGELFQSKRTKNQRGRKLERGNSTSATYRLSHRRVKSLIRFELNDYTLGDIRRIRENMETQPKKPFTAKVSIFKDLTRQQKLALACLCLVDFSSFCSMSIMVPFFPKEAKERGMSEMTCGFVFCFHAFVIFISSPFFGKILPRIGGKFLFLSGLFFNSSCNLLFGLLEYIRDDWMFAVFCFLGQGLKALGASAYWTASYVFVAEIFPSNIGTVVGLQETFVGLGLSIGPTIGGFSYHMGGFGLPFYLLGSALLLTYPVAFWCLPSIEGAPIKKKPGGKSFFHVITEPSVFIIGLVVVVTSIVWAFLDPTLEPHLREFGLTPGKIGLIFLLFSAPYGLSSPFWGFVSDKTNNHWFMMTSGLLASTVALLMLGPAPFLPFIQNDLKVDLVALTILGISIALSLLPTFQGLLSSIADAKGDTENDIASYSLVAGIWSSLYALGEVIGPLLGGVLTANYGFATCCTVVAGATFTLAVGSFIYFIIRDCLASRGKRYRYKFDDSDGYESDCSDNSVDVNQPLLQPDYKNRLYTEENSC